MKEISLKANDIKELIINRFGNIIAQDGFVYKKMDSEFYRKDKDFTYIYNLLLTTWSTSYSLDIRLYISQKKVENIFESIVGKWRHRLTFHQGSIDRIFYSPDGREIVKGESLHILLVKDEDSYTMLDLLESYYWNIAKPYFNQLKTLSDLDDFINKAPFFEYSPAYVGINTDERCMKGLIIAKLVNNPNYAQLVDIYDELIKQAESEESIEKYNRVKEYLTYNEIS